MRRPARFSAEEMRHRERLRRQAVVSKRRLRHDLLRGVLRSSGAYQAIIQDAIDKVGAARRAREARRCRACGCTSRDCTGCIARTGKPCSWVAADLCSACVGGAA